MSSGTACWNWTRALASLYRVLLGAVAQRLLEPKVKELIYIAFDTAATHLYAGAQAHMQNAIG